MWAPCGVIEFSITLNMKEPSDPKRILKTIGVHVVWLRRSPSLKMATSCTTCSDIFHANPVLTDQKHIDEYWEQLRELGRQGMLPDLSEKLQYYVYTIKAGGVCGHKSVVLSSNNIHFVTVELGFYNNDGKWHVKPVTKALAAKNHSKLSFHGKVGKTGHQLINTALDVMKKFGKYHRLFRNCHDYCRMFITANGL